MNVGGIRFCPARMRCRDLAQASREEDVEDTESFVHVGVYGSVEPSVLPCASTRYCPVLTCAALGALCHSLNRADVVRWLCTEMQPMFDGNVARYSVEELDHFLVEKWKFLEETFGVKLAWNSDVATFLGKDNCVGLVDHDVMRCYRDLIRVSSVGDGCVCSRSAYGNRPSGGCCYSPLFNLLEDLLSGVCGDVDSKPIVLDLRQLSTRERVLLLSVALSLTGFLILSKAVKYEECVRATWLMLQLILGDPAPPYSP